LLPRRMHAPTMQVLESMVVILMASEKRGTETMIKMMMKMMVQVVQRAAATSMAVVPVRTMASMAVKITMKMMRIQVNVKGTKGRSTTMLRRKLKKNGLLRKRQRVLRLLLRGSRLIGIKRVVAKRASHLQVIKQ